VDRGDRSSVRKELREQGTMDEDLVAIVSHKPSSTSEWLAKTNEIDTRSTSEAKTNELHEKPSLSII